MFPPSISLFSSHLLGPVLCQALRELQHQVEEMKAQIQVRDEWIATAYANQMAANEAEDEEWEEEDSYDGAHSDGGNGSTVGRGEAWESGASRESGRRYSLNQETRRTSMVNALLKSFFWCYCGTNFFVLFGGLPCGSFSILQQSEFKVD